MAGEAVDGGRLHDLQSEISHAIGLERDPKRQCRSAYLNYLEYSRDVNLDLCEFLELYLDMLRYFSDNAPTLVKTPTPRRNSTASPTSGGTKVNTQEAPAVLDGKALHEPTHVKPGSIQAYISKVSSSTSFKNYKGLDSADKRDSDPVRDAVFCALGAWLAMPNYFRRHPSGGRLIEVAYRFRNLGLADFRQEGAECTLPELLSGSKLIPSNESLSDAIWGKQASIAQLEFGEGARMSTESSYRCVNTASHQSRDVFASLDLLEAASIDPRSLNTHTLSKFAGVRIHWTKEMCRHLLLSKHDGNNVVEVFQFPTVLMCRFPKDVNAQYMREVLKTYPLLFRPYGPYGDNKHNTNLHRFLRRQSWCWCDSCCIWRLGVKTISDLKKEVSHTQVTEHSGREKEINLFDTAIEELIKVNDIGNGWSVEQYPCLWSRIIALQNFQHDAKPWSLWVLFQDRRNTVQYWTFLFAVVIIPLTALQVLLAVIQIVPSF